MENRSFLRLLQPRLILLTFFLILLGSCGKRNEMNWLFYDETQCADQWERTNNNEKLKQNIEAYFDHKGVRIYQMEIFFDRTPEMCAACTCKTGRRVKVKVKGKDVSTMHSEGFYDE